MLYPEKMEAPFPAGTFARMEAALREGEERTALVREAVERELTRREREAARTPKPKP